MARQFPLLTGALLALALTAQAQEGADGKKAKPSPARPMHGAMSPEFENVRKAIEALTPEQRQRFQENFQRWANLSPEKKEALREREEFRKKRMTEEIDAAISEAVLTLDSNRRELFVKRYGEERRKIEEQLRKEMDEKRKPLITEIVAKLKTEFSAPALSK